VFSPTQVLDSFHLFSIMFSHVLWETFKATHSSWNLTMATSDHCWNKGAQVSRVESCTLYKGKKNSGAHFCWGWYYYSVLNLASLCGIDPPLVLLPAIFVASPSTKHSLFSLISNSPGYYYITHLSY
jgi:hypothetical protein